MSLGPNHMRLSFYIFILLCCKLSLALAGTSCGYELSGFVRDAQSGEPIPNVLVVLDEIEMSTISNEDGSFSFQALCNQEYSIRFSHLVYQPKVRVWNPSVPDILHVSLKEKVFSLEAVTVEEENLKGEGTESIVQNILTKKEISINPTQSLASAIAEVQGVTFLSAGTNVQLPVIHGLYGNRILVLNNGLKHGFQSWGADHAPEIDMAGAGNITVVKGAAGVRYGPDALGGVVMVDSDPLELDKPLEVGAGTGYQTNGRGYFGRFDLRQGSENISWHAGGNYTRIGDRETPDYSLTNSGKEEKAFNAGFRYHKDNLNAKVYYSFVDQNLALLRASIAESGNLFVQAINSDRPLIVRPFSYSIGEPNQLTQHHLLKGELNWWYSDVGNLFLRVGRQLNKREEYDVRRNADKPIINLDLVSNDLQLEWKHPDSWGLSGFMGLQYFSQNNDNNPGTGTTPFIPNYNVGRYSFFVIESLENQENTFELGLRFDYENNDVRGRDVSQDLFSDEYSFFNITASLGYIRNISENSTFRTNIGTAWRAPNMAELYSFGQHGFRNTYGLLRYYTDEDGKLKTNDIQKLDDSNVSPEKGYKWINEWSLTKGKDRYTATLYGHYITGFIFDRPIGVFGTIRGPMPFFIYDQTDALFIGTDITWQSAIGESWVTRFGINYLYARNMDTEGALINQPPLNVNAKWTYSRKNVWKFDRSTFTIKPSYTFEQWNAPRTISPEELITGTRIVTTESEIFDFKSAPKGYFLLDLTWSFKAGNLDGAIQIQNVLNTSYRDYLNENRYFADEQGTNLLLTINYTFNHKNN